MEVYLAAKDLQSGYDCAKAAFTDRTYLVLAVANLSGKDEIFEVDYYKPSKGIVKE